MFACTGLDQEEAETLGTKEQLTESEKYTVSYKQTNRQRFDIDGVSENNKLKIVCVHWSSISIKWIRNNNKTHRKKVKVPEIVKNT